MAVGSVVKAIAILRHLAASEPQGVNAIARSIELNPSSCFNILKTLVSEEFVTFDDETKVYGMGPAPFRLFANGVDVGAWTRWLRERLQSIAVRHAASCGFWEVRRGRLVLAEVADSTLSTRIHLSVGQRLPSHAGAMGRCVAAHEGLGRDEVSHIIASLRWQSPPTPAAYWSDMEAARRDGWAIDAGNYLRGVTTVAAPILDTRGKVGHCLAVTLFTDQHDESTLGKIGRELADTATDARHRLQRLE